jgi:hypothetical protein
LYSGLNKITVYYSDGEKSMNASEFVTLNIPPPKIDSPDTFKPGGAYSVFFETVTGTADPHYPRISLLLDGQGFAGNVGDINSNGTWSVSILSPSVGKHTLTAVTDDYTYGEHSSSGQSLPSAPVTIVRSN